MYSEELDLIYLLTTVSVIEYMNRFKNDFRQTNLYSHKSAIVPQLIIANPRSNLNIFQIKFSHSLQSTQFLIVAYYGG